MSGRICKIAFLLLLLIIPLSPFTMAQTGLVNINVATREELDALPGVGPAIAQRIIDGRPYVSVNEISKVQGIGDPGSSTYENIIGLITIGDSGSEPAAATTPQSSTSSGGTASVHYSTSPVGVSKQKEKISLSAGRDRLGSVGSPLEFRAETNLEYKKGSIFTWNFGDGSEKDGDVVVHTYEYPGDYVVVLSAILPHGRTIARTNVKILESDVAVVAATPEKVELKNNSKYETSLFGKGLVHGNKVFVFPQDTIILPGKSISFGSKTTGLKPNNINEISILTVGESRNGLEIMAKAEEHKAKRISEINDKLAALETQMASLSYQNRQASDPVAVVEAPTITPQPALVLDAVQPDNEAEPGGWLSLLKRFFLRTDK